MKYLTLFPLQGHWGKWFGGAVALVALLAGALVTLTETSILDRFAAPEFQLSGCAMLIGLGLYLMAMSKERIDDERVQRIRYTALRGAVMLHFIAAFSFLFPALLEATKEGFTIELSDLTSLICLLMVAPSLLYLIIFHVGLQLDSNWAYNDLGAEEHIRKNPWILVFLVLILLSFGAQILFEKL